MQQSENTQRTQGVSQSLLAPAILLDHSREHQREGDVLGEVCLRADGGEQAVGFGGDAGLVVVDECLGGDAVVDNAGLEEEVVGGEGRGEGRGYGEVEAEGCEGN